MVKVDWSIEITKRAENNISQILLNLSQNTSLQQAQSFLRDFYNILDNLRSLPRMYAKLAEMDNPNIRQLIFKKYRVIYELLENEKVIRVLTIFHTHQRFKF